MLSDRKTALSLLKSVLKACKNRPVSAIYTDELSAQATAEMGHLRRHMANASERRRAREYLRGAESRGNLYAERLWAHERARIAWGRVGLHGKVPESPYREFEGAIRLAELLGDIPGLCKSLSVSSVYCLRFWERHGRREGSWRDEAFEQLGRSLRLAREHGLHWDEWQALAGLGFFRVVTQDDWPAGQAILQNARASWPGTAPDDRIKLDLMDATLCLLESRDVEDGTTRAILALEQLLEKWPKKKEVAWKTECVLLRA